MKVFMLGWEFPPYISGGLGTACAGLTRGLNEAGVEVAFVSGPRAASRARESASSSPPRPMSRCATESSSQS